MNYLFVDSDFFVATVKNDDLNYKKANLLLEKALDKSFSFCTSNYVFSEVVTVLSQRMGKEAAVRFIEMVNSESGYEIIRVNEDLEKEAIKIFRDQTSKNVSFVDCTNMAIMREDSKIKAILSFDEVYRKNGLKTAADVV